MKKFTSGFILLLILSLSLSPFTFAYAEVSEDSWIFLEPMPTVRHSMGVAVANGKIYVIGGRDSTMILDAVEIYDPLTETWDTTAAPLPTPRCFAGSAVCNDKIYIIGGMRDLYGYATDLVERYDPATNQWEIVERLARLLEPVYNELIRQAAQGEVVFNDDTGVKILELMKENEERRENAKQEKQAKKSFG